MGRHKGFKHTEEEKEKLRIARKKYLEKAGTLFGISEKDNKKEYMKTYQRLWRKKHKHYYRDLKRKQKEVQEMQKLENLVSKFNEIQVNCLEVKYGTSAFNENKMKALVEDLNKMMNDCIEELKNESEVKEENKDENK